MTACLIIAGVLIVLAVVKAVDEERQAAKERARRRD